MIGIKLTLFQYRPNTILLLSSMLPSEPRIPIEVSISSCVFPKIRASEYDESGSFGTKNEEPDMLCAIKSYSSADALHTAVRDSFPRPRNGFSGTFGTSVTAVELAIDAVVKQPDAASTRQRSIVQSFTIIRPAVCDLRRRRGHRACEIVHKKKQSAWIDRSHRGFETSTGLTVTAPPPGRCPPRLRRSRQRPQLAKSGSVPLARDDHEGVFEQHHVHPILLISNLIGRERSGFRS